ncbi:MAG: 30S ribosomal protein S8 [Nanoarchaeota archaeon]
MSQDVVADALNMIRNAKRAGKSTVKLNRISNLLVEILKIMKRYEAVKKYKIDSKEKSIEVTIGELMDCGAIKPRFNVNVSQIEKYKRRYLPARGIGIVLVSTNGGLLTHEEAMEEKKGGALIAYFY